MHSYRVLLKIRRSYYGFDFCFSSCRNALPYLVHACNLNSKLFNSGNPGQAVTEQLLTHWRRVCFLRLNELAVEMFKSSDWKSVCGGLELVSELVVPCIRRLSASPQADDSLAVEQVRNCWCNFLASPLDGKETPFFTCVTSQGFCLLSFRSYPYLTFSGPC